jgi:WD40 repeat protein/serine/threonine protein kinase
MPESTSNDATMAYQPAEPPAPATMAANRDALSLPAVASSANDNVIPGYEILGELGRGGMGVVYKARQTALNRTVALKMILSGKFAGENQLVRFQAEAEALAKLQHPNIVQVFDVGSHHGHAYIALEYVEGGNLSEKLHSVPQTARESARLVEILARAIHSAHEVGIVHRDLKPVNILLQPFVLGDARSGSNASHHRSASHAHSRSSSRQSIMTHTSVDYGTPKITDFGLAKQEEGAASSGLTNAGSIMGTPSYMSPEQAIGDVGLIGPATDTYALGAILYEMLTGRPPFRADTPVNTIMQVIRGEVVSPAKLVAKLPKDLETITLKCLEKSTFKRYPSAEALADDLAAYLEDRPISARPITPLERFTKWVHRRPLIAGMLGLIILGVLSFIVLGIWAYVAVTERARQAEVAKEAASESARESQQRLIRLAVANGAQRLELSDMLGAACWFAEALKLDEQNKQAELIHRKRIAAVLNRSPILAHLWRHESSVNDIALSPDGKVLASGGNDGLLRLWAMKDGKPVIVPIEHGTPIASVSFSPDGREILALSLDGSAKLWQWDPTVSSRMAGQGLAIARFLPDGKSILIVNKSGGMTVVSRSTLEPASLQLNHSQPVTDVAFTRSSTHALTASRDGYLRWWDLTKGQLATTTMKSGSPQTAVTLHPQEHLGAVGSEDGLVTVWNLQTGEPSLQQPIRHDAAITQVQFSPDGRWLATSSDDKQCIVWNATNGQQFSPRLRHGSRVTRILFSADARWICTLSEDNYARIWEIRTGRLVVSPFRHNGMPQACLFTPNGRGLLTAGHDQLLRHWILPIQLDEEVEDKEIMAIARPLISNDSRIATSPNGKIAANYRGDQPVRLRNATTREPLGDALKTNGSVSAVAFSQDNQWLVTGGAEGEVQVWSTANSQPRWAQPGHHTSKVFIAAFHPRGELLATGSDDNSIRVWNAVTGEPLYAPIRHEGGVYWLNFSSDGTTLFSASVDGTSRVWDSATGEPITPRLPGWKGTPWKDDLDSTSVKVDDLLALTQALTGTQVDKQGGMTLLDARSIAERYASVFEKSENTYVPTDDADWHEYHAQASEKTGNWFAAAWHLQRLTQLQSQSTVYRQRLAQAWSQMGAWTKVITTATEVLRQAPDTTAAWLQRGQAYGELKQWRESMRDIAQAARLQQQPQWKLAMSTLMAIEQRDTKLLEAERAKLLALLKLSQKTLDADSLAVLSQVLVLQPGPAEQFQHILAEVDRLKNHRDYSLLLAALLYRSGQVELAQTTLQDAKLTSAQALLWQALIDKKRGQAAPMQLLTIDKLKAMLQQAALTDWQDHVIQQTLLRELEEK